MIKAHTFILKVLYPYRFHQLGSIISVFLIAVAGNVKFYLIKVFIDSTFNDARELVYIIGLYMLCDIVRTTGWILADLCGFALHPRISAEIVSQLTEKVSTYRYSFFQNTQTGSLTSKLNDVFTLLPDCLNTIYHHFMSSGINTFITLYLLFKVHPLFALSLFVFCLFCFFLNFTGYQKVLPLTKGCTESKSKLWGYITDYFSNFLNVRTFGNEKYEKQLFSKYKEHYIKQANHQLKFLIKFYNSFDLFFCFYMVCCIFFTIQLKVSHQISSGNIALIFTLNLQMIERLYGISQQTRKFITQWSGLKKTIEDLNSPSQILDHPQSLPFSPETGKIVFDKVSFAYPNTPPLFKGLSIEIKPRQKVGLVGYSGGGKSTFVNLILRLFELEEGTIQVDHQDIKLITQESLRQNIAFITQDPSLFHRSILENIQYGNLEATPEQVIEASKKAHAHEFIEKLPHQYESLVGERGIKLSGGQRQRIAIARAILKNAPILILDEATSQLDSLTEHKIQESLLNLMESKTSLVIAHRLSTLLHMDRILVFEKGKIIEDGSHTELLSQEGLYKTLWNTQVGGFLRNEI